MVKLELSEILSLNADAIIRPKNGTHAHINNDSTASHQPTDYLLIIKHHNKSNDILNCCCTSSKLTSIIIILSQLIYICPRPVGSNDDGSTKASHTWITQVDIKIHSAHVHNNLI